MDQIRDMGEARTRKILGTPNTHDMDRLENTDLGCEFLARRQAMVREGTTNNREARRLKRAERKASRRREARDKQRRIGAKGRARIAARAIADGAAWKAKAAKIRAWKRQHAELVASGLTHNQATERMAQVAS